MSLNRTHVLTGPTTSATRPAAISPASVTTRGRVIPSRASSAASVSLAPRPNTTRLGNVKTANAPPADPSPERCADAEDGVSRDSAPTPIVNPVEGITLAAPLPGPVRTDAPSLTTY